MKRPAASRREPDRKRTGLPRASDYAKSFLKDWDRLSRSGRYDLNRLKEAMVLLITNVSPLGPEWKDHRLKGEWASFREWHIGGVFLLIYQLVEISGPGGGIVFIRAGTHIELFR